jgi:hypothetical protein
VSSQHGIWVKGKKKKSRRTPVAHAHKPSYSGGRDQKDCSLKPAPANSSTSSYLEKIHHKKRAGGVAQGEDHELKPEYPVPAKNPNNKQWVKIIFLICKVSLPQFILVY